MWPNALDLHTLHVEHALLLGLFTVLTAVNTLAHRGEYGTRWFPIYTFSAFLGAILIALRGVIPDTLSVVLGTVLFPIAYVFLYLSVAEFFSERARGWQLQLLFVVASALTLLRWGIFAPNTTIRVGVYSALLAVQLGATALFVLRRTPRGGTLTSHLAHPENPPQPATAAGQHYHISENPLRWAGLMMAAVLGLLAMNNLLRSVGVFLYGAPANYLQGNRQLSWALLMTSVLQGAATIAFVWMTAARLQGELRLEAATDPLTRLLNRRAIATWAKREIHLSQENGWPLSAILIDLDEFKSINDLWGHGYGDTVLLEVSRTLSTQLRPGDQLGRLGGDEFILLLPRTPEEIALEFAERLRLEIASITCRADGSLIGVHASFGVSELGGLGLTWEELIERCDKALYRVKSLGGNRTLVH